MVIVPAGVGARGEWEGAPSPLWCDRTWIGSTGKRPRQHPLSISWIPAKFYCSIIHRDAIAAYRAQSQYRQGYIPLPRGRNGAAKTWRERRSPGPSGLSDDREKENVGGNALRSPSWTGGWMEEDARSEPGLPDTGTGGDSCPALHRILEVLHLFSPTMHHPHVRNDTWHRRTGREYAHSRRHASNTRVVFVVRSSALTG